MTIQQVTRLGSKYKKLSEDWKRGKASWLEVENAYKEWEQARAQLYKERGWSL